MSEPVPGDNIIPPHCNPVEFMMRQADPSLPTYTPLQNLDEAKAHPHGVMVMVADSGGQVLLSIPARLVHASPAALNRLLADLENITWGNGFDADDLRDPCEADIYFQVAAPGTGLWGGCGGGLVIDGLWLHGELEELLLREPILAVLHGREPRLDLPRFLKWKEAQALSLEEAKPYPRAQVTLRSGREIKEWLTCPVSIIAISEPDLYTLIDLIDAWSAKRWPCMVVREGKPNTVVFSPRFIPQSINERDVRLDSIRLGFTYLEPILPLIEATLRGQRPLAPFD